MTRILVEKKEQFRLDERDMFLEIRDVLNVSDITGVRIFNGYDVEGVKDLEKATQAVFTENGQDIAYNEMPDTDGAAFMFAITAAIDQYDQREDFATQLLRISEPQSEPKVNVFKIIALYGDISEADLEKIKTYYINPLEMREIALDSTKSRVYSEPQDVEKIKGFATADDATLKSLAEKYGIAMALDNLVLCREYFAKEKRDPTITEMKVLDTYWSDHCRHSTFLTIIDDIKIEENEYTEALRRAEGLYEQAKEYVYGDVSRPLCLMDIATMEMKKLRKNGLLADMEESDEVNACSIEVTVPVDGKPTDMIVMFKNETHNHPTEMEPFGGASTCLGGAIRDPLSGRAHVFGAIRVTGSDDQRAAIEDTLPGKLPQRKITRTAAEGYSSYGNGIGLALGQLIEAYDPGFKAKRMECGAVVAAAKKENIVRGKPLPGDVVVLVGGRTGRDGCGGATGSSKEHDEDSLEQGGAEVQKGNPVVERNVVRLFRKPHVSKMIKICNDFGAGGVCVAVGELADGLNIDLDKVPTKYPGLDGTELAISESQERMAVVIAKEDLEKFLDEAAKENLEAVKIADVTDTGHVSMKWRGDEILSVSSDFLNSGGVRQRTNITVSCFNASEQKTDSKEIKSKWLETLADLNVCSKKGIAERFDSTAGGGTVFMPYGGVNQKTPEQGLAMRLPLTEGETDFGTLMTVGYNPSLGKQSPFHAAMYAVIESVMKIVAMGGDYSKVRLSFQEYFERLVSDESWGKPYAALMGAFLAQDELEIPAIGGKDSMSGTFMDINVPPSLISFAVAVADTTKLVSRAFKGTGNNVYLLKTPIDSTGMPNFKVLKRNMSTVNTLVEYGCIKSASVVGMGGIAATVSEMAFGNGIGIAFDPRFAETLTDDLFAPQYATMVLEIDTMPKDCKGLREEFILLGTTTDKGSIEINDVEISLDEAQTIWEGALSSVFPIQNSPTLAVKNANSQCCDAGASCEEIKCADSQTAKVSPRVLIPIFPGSTGEYELEKQFTKAGADVNTVVFRTLTANEIEDSYAELAKAVSNADILAIPSGMSAGAEPDGSSKLIAMILRQTDVKNAINKMISERKGLVLGTGEAFKALLKVGLIQTGLVQDDECGNVVLTTNPTNAHYCTLKSVKIAENAKSPWLVNMGGKIETVPVSGKDNVVHMSDELFNEYCTKGQITSQYINDDGSGSVESMISENGLILGRVGLVENMSKGLYANVTSVKDSKIFCNAVRYINR
ncbi:MAG: phosphoribosylformylglycinamidine synthase [Oscillospiraceae bacterium]|nr:phosphoribosylformylglycinamidine synthase [Oscillospiraceae bacterium]